MSNELWVIADALLFFLMLLPFLNAAKWGKGGKCIRFVFSKSWVNFLWIGCLLFCLYNKTEGDYFHYQEYLEEINSSKFKAPIFEAPYMFLASIVGNNYFLFRLLIWGGALLVFRRILKIVGLENSMTVSIFILFTLIAFAYGRVAFALSVFYLGFVCYYLGMQYCNSLKLFAGILLIAISFFFHKSAFFLIVLYLSLLLFRLSKLRMILLVLAIPIGVYAVNISLGEILTVQSSLSQVNRGIYYLSNAKESLGPAMLISISLNYIPMVLLMCVMARVYFSKTSAIPIYIKKMYEISFLLILFSLILLFVDSGGRYLFVRIKEMSYIPFCIILSYYLVHFRISKKIGFISFSVIFIYVIYYFAYAYYLKSIGSGI